MKKFIFAALLIASCSTSPFEANYKKIQANQTKEDVRLLLGEPQDHSLKDGVETWIYKTKDKAIQFKDSKVTAYGSVSSLTGVAPAQPNTSQAQASPTPLQQNLNLGERCESDTQCVSQNCHFKRCSGANNCYVPEGQRCASDQQCCTGLCDFSICKKKR